MIFIDTHAHFYECFNFQKLLDAAVKNFDCASENSRDTSHQIYVIILIGIKGFNRFKGLAQQSSHRTSYRSIPKKSWQISPTSDPDAFIAFRKDQKELVLVPGCQIVTREKLEVLALLTQKIFEEGVDLVDTVQAVLDAGGIVSLPWGFGKWTGKRGELLKEMITDRFGKRIFLGDNGNRPQGGGTPSMFKIAVNQGLGVLSGTDTLPLKNEELRTGSFCSIIDARLDRTRPASHLKTLLTGTDVCISHYGKNMELVKFAKNQLRLRLRRFFPQ